MRDKPVLKIFRRQKESDPITKVPESVQPIEEPAKPGFLGRLKTGLLRTRKQLSDGLATLFLGKKIIDAEVLEELEVQLLSADLGVDATAQIIGDLTDRLARHQLGDPQALRQALQANLQAILEPCETVFEINSIHRPFVILMAGINGAGKTTTIGKLAKQFQKQGRKVLLAAGDTFRAAAVEQLQIWGERNQIPVITQGSGADSASVIYDAFQAAKARNVDVLIADTAGRLHTQHGLMEELKKIKRVLKKIDDTAPHEVWLVLDAGTGQNALVQAMQFHAAIHVTGLILSKLDGTAKGGIIFAIAQKLKLPIRFIGIGEGIDDLRPFAADEFVSALFAKEETDQAG